jgi:hypothetical protein
MILSWPLLGSTSNWASITSFHVFFFFFQFITHCQPTVRRSRMYVTDSTLHKLQTFKKSSQYNMPLKAQRRSMDLAVHFL